MEPRPLLVLLITASLMIPAAVAQNDTAAEDDATDDGTTEEPPEECYEDENGTWMCEDEGSYQGDDAPPEECYEDEQGEWVCEDEAYGDEEHPPEDDCYQDENGTWVCEDEAYGDEEHPPEEECYQDENGDWVCEEDPGAEPQDPPPPGGHPPAAHEEEVPCRPHPDERGAMICRPPPSCEDKLYETQACTPPPECEDNGDGTVTCRMPADAGPGPGPERGPPPSGSSAGQPDCRPAEDERGAMICRPPPSCEGKLYETQACTPPPECEDNGDGTFTCRMPAEAADTAAADRTRGPSDTSAREHHDQRREELRSSMVAEVEDAMRSFRGTLEDLRSEYQDGKAQLEQRYEDGKDELRADYRACLEAIPDDAPRSEQLGEKLTCKQDAREGLRELRNELLAERDLLREDLLGQAEEAHFRTCSALDERLHGLMVDAGAFNADLGDVLSPEDLALCSGILLDLGSSQPAEGSDWFSSEFGGGGDR